MQGTKYLSQSILPYLSTGFIKKKYTKEKYSCNKMDQRQKTDISGTYFCDKEILQENIKDHEKLEKFNISLHEARYCNNC